MSTLYESYNVAPNDSTTSVAYYLAETFTPSVSHTITSVKLFLYREGSPGNVTISIRATDVNGHPTGSNLCSGTVNGDTLLDDYPYEWRETTFGAGYYLIATIKYAIVLYKAGDVSNLINWLESTAAGYAGGTPERSADGATWETLTGYDRLFEEWGTTYIPPRGFYPNILAH